MRQHGIAAMLLRPDACIYGSAGWPDRLDAYAASEVEEKLVIGGPDQDA